MKTLNLATYLVVATAIFYLVKPDDTAEATHVSVPIAELSQVSTASHEPRSGRLSDSLLTSPFGRGEPRPVLPQSERIKERQRHMEANRYSTPPAYFSMTLLELHTLAKQQDMYALLQLGERYWSESEDYVGDPAFDKTKSPKQTAIDLIAGAAEQGHSHAATIASSMYERQGQEQQAYTWALIAELMGDKSLQSQRVGYETRLPQAQREEAEATAYTTNLRIQQNVLAMLTSKTASH